MLAKPLDPDAFAALYAISLTSELLGTGTGLPFGEYSYTPLLGIKWFGLVPVVIPLVFKDAKLHPDQSGSSGFRVHRFVG